MSDSGDSGGGGGGGDTAVYREQCRRDFCALTTIDDLYRRWATYYSGITMLPTSWDRGYLGGDTAADVARQSEAFKFETMTLSGRVLCTDSQSGSTVKMQKAYITMLVESDVRAYNIVTAVNRRRSMVAMATRAWPPSAIATTTTTAAAAAAAADITNNRLANNNLGIAVAFSSYNNGDGAASNGAVTATATTTSKKRPTFGTAASTTTTTTTTTSLIPDSAQPRKRVGCYYDDNNVVGTIANWLGEPLRSQFIASEFWYVVCIDADYGHRDTLLDTVHSIVVDQFKI